MKTYALTSEEETMQNKKLTRALGGRSNMATGVVRIKERRNVVGPFAVITFSVVRAGIDSRGRDEIRGGFLDRPRAFAWAKGEGFVVLGCQEKVVEP